MVLFLLAADLCLILAHLLDDRIWRKALEHYINLRPYMRPGFEPPKLEDSTSEQQSRCIASSSKEPNQPQTKQINYKRTYFEIDFNVHLMDIAMALIRMDSRVYSSPLSRALIMNIWLKVPCLQLTIVACQYCSTLALCVLLAYDILKSVATIYAYLKYKYLKNIICLLMELISSISIIFFLTNAIIISPKRFDETILDFYQDAGIWIVSASCVAEYLLLLTYIGVAAYDFFKNRKMMKKMNLKPKYSLIHYSDSSDIMTRKPAQFRTIIAAGSLVDRKIITNTRNRIIEQGKIRNIRKFKATSKIQNVNVHLTQKFKYLAGIVVGSNVSLGSRHKIKAPKTDIHARLKSLNKFNINQQPGISRPRELPASRELADNPTQKHAKKLTLALPVSVSCKHNFKRF